MVGVVAGDSGVAVGEGDAGGRVVSGEVSVDGGCFDLVDDAVLADGEFAGIGVVSLADGVE